jgi:hypothetical protein
MGCRPYEPRYFHPNVVATGWNDCFGLQPRNGEGATACYSHSGVCLTSDGLIAEC